MATLQRTETITFSDTVTAQTLHDLIETANFTGLAASDFDEPPYYVYTSSATPNPSLYPFWLDTSWKETVVRVFAKPWDIWVTVGPDRFEIPFRNASATEALMGALVIASGASEFSMATAPSLNALGFVQANTPAGAWGPVCSFGMGWVLYASNISLAQVSTGALVDPRGGFLSTCGFWKPNAASGDWNAGSTTSGIIWGIWLRQTHTGYTNSLTPLLSFITGPRNSIGF